MKKRPKIPRLDGGPQTILMVEDVARTAKFYQDVMRLEARDGDGERYVEFETGDGGMLLIVNRSGSIAPLASVAAAESPATLTFSIPPEGYAPWKKWMTKHGVKIAHETKWVHGGRSLYVLDPDGRRVEFKAPPGPRSRNGSEAVAESVESVPPVEIAKPVEPPVASRPPAPEAAPATTKGKGESPGKGAQPAAKPGAARDGAPPPVHGVVETILYVDDLPKAVAFYRDVLGLTPMNGMPGRFQSFDSGAGRVLLLFVRGSTLDPMTTPGGVIPPHDGHGPHHIAFAIEAEHYETWRTRLRAGGVVIESETLWDRGGRSLYFRDHDKHLVELATPGIWPIY